MSCSGTDSEGVLYKRLLAHSQAMSGAFIFAYFNLIKLAGKIRDVGLL